jgi:hypothetical protein
MGVLSIAGQQTGIPQGTNNINLSVTFSNISYVVEEILANGFTAITVPTVTGTSGPNGVIIIPSVSNSATMTLKGITGDTGILISKNYPTVIAFPQGDTQGTTTNPATFGITSSALQTVPTTFLFF